MAKIVRGPDGPKLRDDKGNNTGINFRKTGEDREVWISDRTIKGLYRLIWALVLLGVFAFNPGFAEPAVKMLLGLRGAIF